jgi:site-specific DNA-methyltransferase (cytosine-N4-specific)
MDNIDIILIDKFQKLIKNNPEYWDFKEAKKDHIHGICVYPATMVPIMQSKILKILLETDSSINNIFDPFMGSGTILVEGMINNLDVYGCDINPLSYLISYFKINIPTITELNRNKNILFNYLLNINNHPLISFKDINKWYKQDIIKSLSKIHYCIKKINNRFIRNFFWICLAEVSRLGNNSRNSTFKLHIKSNEDIKNFKLDVINCFKEIVTNNINRVKIYININNNLIDEHKSCYSYLKKKSIYLGDSLNITKNYFNKNSIDLIITSPPYGDNATTVTYGQFSTLPLRWIDINDLNIPIDDSLININSKIDSISLGGKKYSIDSIKSSNILNKSQTLKKIFDKLISSNELSKARKVASFILDFEKVFYQLRQILKPNGYMVLTVGNRRVSNNEIKFNEIIKELCIIHNLKLIYEFNRNILYKRLPAKISKLKDNVPVKSISKEYILIIKK